MDVLFVVVVQSAFFGPACFSCFFFVFRFVLNVSASFVHYPSFSISVSFIGRSVFTFLVVSFTRFALPRQVQVLHRG